MMDEVSGGKRCGNNKASKSSNLLLRETAGRRSEPCSKLGCGSRLNHTSRGQIGFSQKAKYMRSSSIRSTCTAGKEVASRNNNSAAITCNLNKGASSTAKHSSSSRSRTTNSEEQGVTAMEVVESASSLDSSSQGDGSCSSVKSKRSCRSSSSAAASSVSVGPRKLTAAAANVGNQGRLKSMKCNSMSDVVAPVPSSNRSRVNNKRKDVAIKSSRNFEGETISSRAKKKMIPVSSPNPPRRSGLSVPTARLSRSETVQGRRPPPPPSSSSSLHARDICFTSPIIPTDENVLHARDTPQQFSLQQCISLEEGIAEMLAACERIERRNGRGRLDHEQFLTQGFYTDLATTYDQHREMRMDIDDMSYEELLALEERIGSVSTALTEETLSKCVETYLYPTAPPSCNDSEFIRSADDTKCSICQEDYSSGEEIGRLQCKHMYHSECITQWLGLKNWCPICKASVESSSSSSTSSTHGNKTMLL